MPSRRREPLRPSPYNPLAEENLARAIREEMERQEVHPLPPEKFLGAGLYALYYVGDFPIYKGISDPAGVTPIYVGKAAAGKSPYGRLVRGEETDNLYSRILGHRNSIREAATNLRVEDFRVRYLVTSDIHIVLGEAGLLRAYRPVLWNTVVTGFGSNAAGSARTNGRSIWDTLHGGRARAAHLRPNRLYTRTEAEELVQAAINMRLTGNEIPERLTTGRSVIWTADEEGPGATIHDRHRYGAEPRPQDRDGPPPSRRASRGAGTQLSLDAE